jgi:hypothetical protein
MADPTPHGPYHLEFAASLDNGKITINPASIRLLGRNGAECVGWQFDRTFPPRVVMSIGGKQIPLARMEFA